MQQIRVILPLLAAILTGLILFSLVLVVHSVAQGPATGRQHYKCNLLIVAEQTVAVNQLLGPAASTPPSTPPYRGHHRGGGGH